MGVFSKFIEPSPTLTRTAQKAKWTETSRVFSKDGTTNKFELDASVGPINYHDGTEYKRIDLLPFPSDDPKFSWMVDRVPGYDLYLNYDGGRRIVFGPGKYVDLPAPTFLKALGPGTLNKNRLEWRSPDLDVDIIWNARRIAFDVTLKKDPGFNSLSFPMTKEGLTDKEVEGLISELKVYELKTDPLEISAERLLTSSVLPDRIDISWDATGMEYPIVVDPTIDVSPAVVADDATHKQNHAFDTTDLAYCGFLGGANYWDYWCRFPSCSIDNGATIDVAYITLVIAAFGNNAAEGVIYGADEDDATQIADDATFHSGARTTESATWSMSGGAEDDAENTPSLAAIVEAIVGRGGWASGNALGFFILENATTSSSYRSWDSQDQGDTDPVLHVEWTEAAAGGPLAYFEQIYQMPGIGVL